MPYTFLPTIALFFLLLFTGCQEDRGGTITLYEANPEAGFNYPYYLFIPDNVDSSRVIHVVVEPNNSGFVDDDLQKHVDKAERTASMDFYVGNYVARIRKSPLLVPVFPRSKSNWQLYTHALDRDVMLERETTLERIDRQLLAMYKDAREKLLENNIKTKDSLIMLGFSASGSFANRFTALHPEKVAAVAAGGVNGLLVLPVDSLHGKALPYPLGTADFLQISGRPFDLPTFQQTPQFYFMGALDDNDAIPYDDGYNQQERDLVYELIGREMMPERWQTCQDVYDSMNINAMIKTYPKTGHEQTAQIKDDIVTFLNKQLPLNAPKP